MEDILSKRGKPKFADRGFLFLYEGPNGDQTKLFWRCQSKNSEKCKARLHTTPDGERVLKRCGDHTHESIPAEIEVAKAMTRIKKRAAETQERTSQVIHNVADGLSLAAQGKMPRMDAVRKVIRRQRNEIRGAPIDPANTTELVIPEEFTTYRSADGREERFILADSGPGPRRIVILGREGNLEMLRQARKWFIDGTFSISPKIFGQVYVLLARKLGAVHPILYALLPPPPHMKTRETYDRLFAMIDELCPNMMPLLISCDFELAAIQAVAARWPQAQLQGCLFHLAKNGKKKLGQLQLGTRYQEDDDFQLKARMIFCGLPFVPIADLADALRELSEWLPDELQPVLDWMEDAYIGRPERRNPNRRRVPTFPPELWNCYERVLNDDDCTNNFAEAAHRRVQTELGVDHPTIWALIDGLKKVQKSRDLYYEHILRGDNPDQKRKKYKDKDARIKRAVRNYDQYTKVEFCRAIANNIIMQR